MEPFGKNTAPAIALGTLKAIAFENDPILGLSADHFISDEDKFIQTIQKGIEYAEKGSIVTFGIYPKFLKQDLATLRPKRNLTLMRSRHKDKKIYRKT